MDLKKYQGVLSSGHWDRFVAVDEPLVLIPSILFDRWSTPIQAGLALDPRSSALAASLAAAKEAQENERRERWRLAALERDAEEERRKQQHAAKARAKVEAAESAGSKTNSAPTAGKEPEVSADPLSSFFSEIEGDKDKAPPAKVERVLNDKYTTQELGTPKEQMDRLLQQNYKWKNLNAFDALQLGGDATVEDIKQRYVMSCTLLRAPAATVLILILPLAGDVG